MPTRIMRLGQRIAKATDIDTILEALYEAGKPPHLNLVCIWSMGAGDRAIEFSKVYYHRTISKQFQEDSKAITEERGLSPMAQLALTGMLPFTMTESKSLLQISGGDEWAYKFLRERGVRDALYIGQGDWYAFYRSGRVLERNLAVTRDTREIVNTVFARAIFRIKELLLPKKANRRAVVVLSPRELAVLRHLSNGETQPQIAKHLELSEHTVRNFIRRAVKKLNAKNQLHAVSIAIKRRLI